MSTVVTCDTSHRAEGGGMVALALIFLVIAALLTIAIIPASSGESVDLELFGAHMTVSVAGMYVTGLVVGVIAVLSARLLRFGVVREWRQRKRIKDLERRAKAAGTPATALPEQRTDDESAATVDEPAQATESVKSSSAADEQADDTASDGWSVPGLDESARHETP